MNALFKGPGAAGPDSGDAVLVMALILLIASDTADKTLILALLYILT